MILQYHDVTWHERPVEFFRYLHGLLGRVLVWLRYDHQHVLVVEIEIPDVCEYGAKLADAVQF